jgi:hypothetical protein
LKRSASLILAIGALSLVSACHQKLVYQGSPKVVISPAPSSKPGTVTLTVDVNTGGSCVGLNDSFELLGGARHFNNVPVLSRSTTPQVLSEGGIVPCTFRFYFPDVPKSSVYFIHDVTTNTGWGPWNADGLQRANFHVSVSITDMH